MKYHWIDYPHTFSIHKIRFNFPFYKNDDYDFKWMFQTIKFPISQISSIFFSFRDQKQGCSYK